MIKTGQLGKGTYGTVYTAKLNNKEYAVKRNIIDQDTSFMGSIREMDICNTLKGHPYIANLLDIKIGNPFTTPNSPPIGPYKEDILYFVFEKAEIDGHHLIYNTTYNDRLIYKSMISTLLALEYCHGHNIIHRDLKPANLLLYINNAEPIMKITDFGLSKPIDHSTVSTPRVASSWYRAPEICAQHEYYNEKIDIWSLGCILYEMLTKKSFIQGPDNDLILLHNLFLTHPTVTEDDFTFLQKYSNVNLACTRPKKGFKQTSWKGRVSEMFVPLLERMLTINFNKRSSANELLSLFNDQNNSIKNCQQLYPAINNIVNLSIVNDKTRQVGILLGIELYNHRESIDWYKHRIFFASIDMWDRFLVYMRKEKDFETLNVVEIKLYYITIYYLAMKYFQIMTVPISFRSLLDIFVKLKQFPSFGKEYIQMAEDFEIYLVRDIFQYKIYRATIYEMEKDLSEERIKEMMIYYSRGEGNFGVKEFYKYFCDKMI